MKLLIEQIEDFQYLEEESSKGKSLYIEGIFLQSEIKNKNGRVYPLAVMENAVEVYKKSHIDKNRAIGELGHPKDNDVGMNLKETSHKIVSLKQDGNNFIGKAKILNTPAGKIVQELHDEGVQLGVSSRGLGSIQESIDCKLVKNDFFLCTAADIVHDPSATDAFVSGLLEQKSWVWENGVLKEEKLESMEKKVKEKKSDEEVLAVFESFFNQLKTSQVLIK